MQYRITMSEQTAHMFIEAQGAFARKLQATSVRELQKIHADELADRGIIQITGGPRTRDELVGAIMLLRYPPAQRDQATHVVYHDVTGYTACNYCHDSATGLHDGHLCECDRADETRCTVCGQRAAFHFSTTFPRDGGPVTLTDHGLLGHTYAGRLVAVR